jgi:hypothetical protein
MEELIEYLQQSVENVRGVDMVPLAAALHSVQIASSLNLLASLEQTTADMYKTLMEDNTLGELDIEE